MVALRPPICAFGEPAKAFSLTGTDGKRYTLADCRGTHGFLVMFICNHCPYVRAILDRLIRDCHQLSSIGIGCVAIMSNDITAYPDDGPAEMKRLAETLAFPFPYLHDADQSVARAYGAVCTPDFFGYNATGELQYRGRLDASGKNQSAETGPSELFAAMQEIALTGRGPLQQIPSIGCSIKWANA